MKPLHCGLVYSLQEAARNIGWGTARGFVRMYTFGVDVGRRGSLVASLLLHVDLSPVDRAFSGSWSM